MLPSKSKLSKFSAVNRIITVMCQTMKNTKGQENQKQMEKRAAATKRDPSESSNPPFQKFPAES